MKYTIKQKMSNTGSIHDIASDLYDREIVGVGEYAVVLASYYGGKGYTTHKTAQAAIEQSNKTECSHVIINSQGCTMDIKPGYYQDELV